MAVFMEQVLQIIAALTDAIKAQSAASSTNPTASSSLPMTRRSLIRMLDARDFIGLVPFEGSEGKYAEWAYQFQCAVSASSAMGIDLLKKSAVNVTEIMWENIADDCKQEPRNRSVPQNGPVSAGEAQIIVRSVNDMNGLEAWRMLAKRYRTDTPVRRLQKLIEIISASKAKNASDLGAFVEK
jgi:hypothetical protein